MCQINGKSSSYVKEKYTFWEIIVAFVFKGKIIWSQMRI